MVDLFEQNQSDIANWLGMQSKRVQAESTIINSKDLGQNFMLHIDKKSPKVFIPMMPRSAAHSENNTTARITVSPNLMGCLIGYARADTDFLYGTSKQNIRDTGYRGGYEINEFDFTHCIKPSEKLVFDANRTLEHWLVSYNKDTLQYKNRTIGKVFIHSMTSVAVYGQDPKSMATIFIEHNKPEGIKFSPTIHLKPGYHKAVVAFKDRLNRDVKYEQNFGVKEINESEYNIAKGLSASMLSLQDKKPCMQW